jgi:hypothetical protein
MIEFRRGCRKAVNHCSG